MKPVFEVVGIGGNCYTINDHGRTVATISSQGYIDWLLRSPMQDGPLVESIRCETHLCYTLGFKILLITPTPATLLTDFSYKIEDGGARLILTGKGRTKDGKFESETIAELYATPDGSRYEWDLHTTLTCVSDKPENARRGAKSYDWIEFNNVYPGEAGKCMAFAAKKEYDCTLMVDRDGVVWNFPHQHTLHYYYKIKDLHFAPGTMAGFFGEKTGSPVVIIKESTLEPDWAICDMYYDLHCGARPTRQMNPGESHRFRYTIKYLGLIESEKLVQASKPIPINDDDREKHNYPRLDLGFNTFTRNVDVAGPDEANAFKTKPPQLVWDREEGHAAKGSLRITNLTPEETVWSACPPNQLPVEHNLNITGMIKTNGVIGKGAFIRLRYHTFRWHPEPHVEWVQTIESTPVTGTTDGWVQIRVPQLHVEEEQFDYLVWIDLVLDGRGVAWLTDMDIDLQPAPSEVPELEEGSSRGRAVAAGSSSSASGTAF